MAFLLIRIPGAYSPTLQSDISFGVAALLVLALYVTDRSLWPWAKSEGNEIEVAIDEDSDDRFR